jgi:amino acid transporter
MNFSFGFSAFGLMGSAVYFFAYGLTTGGPVVMVWGWLLNTFFVICISSYMGEMCSCHPAVGTVYYWSSAYAPNGELALFFSYICGWFNFIGNLTFDAGVAYGVSQFFSACNNLMSTTGSEASTLIGVVIAVIVVMLWAGKNLMAIAHQGTIALAITGIMILINCSIPLALVFSSQKLSDTNFVFWTYVNYTGFDDSTNMAYVILVGALFAPMAFTGYDGSLAMAGETI